MFSPEGQQIEICLMKSNLEEIENSIIVQHSALPTLKAENELKYRETISALRDVRSLNSEIERLKQENVRLTAKRVQLKRHSEDITRELQSASRKRSELENLLKQEEDDAEKEISKYEDSLRDIAERFRNTILFSNGHEIRSEIESINKLNFELETEAKGRRNVLIELQREFDLMQPAVPQSLLHIVGKNELDEKLKAQSVEYEALCAKRDSLLNC